MQSLVVGPHHQSSQAAKQQAECLAACLLCFLCHGPAGLAQCVMEASVWCCSTYLPGSVPFCKRNGRTRGTEVSSILQGQGHLLLPGSEYSQVALSSANYKLTANCPLYNLQNVPIPTKPGNMAPSYSWLSNTASSGKDQKLPQNRRGIKNYFESSTQRGNWGWFFLMNCFL